MPTITAGDFRNGVTFEMDGKVMTVVEFQHVKPGKGAAFVRTKYKNVMTGAIREESFNPTAKFEQATVERKDAEYSYNDGDLYYFMDPETYDMVPLNADVLGDAFKFVTENTVCKLLTDMLAANRADVLALMVEPMGGAVTVWQKVLHALQEPFKAVCRRKMRAEH